MQAVRAPGGAEDAGDRGGAGAAAGQGEAAAHRAAEEEGAGARLLQQQEEGGQLAHLSLVAKQGILISWRHQLGNRLTS